MPNLVNVIDEKYLLNSESEFLDLKHDVLDLYLNESNDDEINFIIENELKGQHAKF